ncbi:AI-2E family transporter [Pedomonas mirosovicensis]|uniref:AI-2E family transporter n=1 Tax=Pedomonas mirosovicensis TaxID=2908641 RepID=UPI0021686009|nr:AI-2E family transporter [Pedomonas mirosovicensis]MCH8685845.1 AI-2E family transporter [Pedomonas mirosovicensis]
MTTPPVRSTPGLAPGLMIAGIIAVLVLLGGSAVPFILGWVLCLVLQPARDALRQAGLSNVWAAALATAVGSITVAAILLILILAGAEQLRDFIVYLPELISRIASALQDVVGRGALRAWVPSVASAAEGRVEAGSLIGEDVTRIAPYVFGLTGSVWNFIFVCLLTPFVAFYLLKDGEFLLQRAGSWISSHHALELKLFWMRAKRRLVDFLKGQILLCLVQSLLHAVLLSAIGLEFGFILGIATGIASIIPVLGNFTLFITSLSVAFFQGEGVLLPLGVVAIYGFSEMLETVVLAPKLVGTRINVHPLFIIAVLICGHAIFGLVGAVCALPFAAIMSTFFDALDKPNPIEKT